MASPPGPGPLALVHRITIATAFAGALAYAVWAANQAITTGEASSTLDLVAAIGAVIVIGLYLRNLRGRLDEKLTPGGRSDRP